MCKPSEGWTVPQLWVAGPEGRPPCQRGAGRGEMATGTTGQPGVPKSRAGQGGEGYKDYSCNIKLPVFHLSELESIVYLFSPCGFNSLSKRCRKGRGGDWDYWTAWCAQEQSRAERINNKNRCFKIIFVTFIGYFARCADLAPM